MKRFLLLSPLILLLTLLTACGSTKSPDIYAYRLPTAQGDTLSMTSLRGKVVLIVNTATHCGFTPQYEALEKLYRKYASKNFVIIDFPCNQFGKQAPGTNREIAAFCQEQYDVTFPQMAKIDVNGPAAHPLFTLLKKEQPFAGFDRSSELGARLDAMLRSQDANYDKNADVKWNFTKFLIDRRGRVVRRFEPTAPMTKVAAEVKRLLAQ